MNFLVFNIKVCMIYVRSLNWANYAFHLSSSAFFYQVAAAQDKLVKYNMSHIKQGTCPLLMELSYLINHVLFSLISLTGVVRFLWPYPLGDRRGSDASVAGLENTMKLMILEK